MPSSSGDPVLGLIFPVERPVPEEGLLMYPTGVRFITSNLGLKTLTPDGYDAVLADIPTAARELRANGAEAIALMGTSLSFYKGVAFNRDLTGTIEQASGLHATTMSSAVIEGLRAVNAKRLAVATAYSDEVNSRLGDFLAESGFEVLAIKGLGIVDITRVDDVRRQDLFRFCLDVHRAAPEAEGILVSCGGLRTLEILAELERETGVPAVSSTPHTLRAGVRLLGLSGRVAGCGRLLSQA
jgi:arylmalonate decarboxylase